MSTLDLVLGVARRRGWQTRREGANWQLQCAGLSGHVQLHVSQHWLALRYQLLLGNSHWPGRGLAPTEQQSLYRAALHRNERMYLAKLGFDPEGYPALCVELPVAELTPLLIARGLESMQHNQLRLPPAWQQLPTDADELVVAAGPQVFYAPDTTPGLPEHLMFEYVRLLEPQGWNVRTAPRGIHWHLGYKNALRIYEVYLSVSSAWCCFQVPVLVEARPSVLDGPAATAALFLEYLLRLNDAWFFAKLAVDEHGQVLLLLEVPTDAMSPALFRSACRTIAAYLDRYGQELQIMAALDRDSRLAAALARARTTPSVVA